MKKIIIIVLLLMLTLSICTFSYATSKSEDAFNSYLKVAPNCDVTYLKRLYGTPQYMGQIGTAYGWRYNEYLYVLASDINMKNITSIVFWHDTTDKSEFTVRYTYYALILATTCKYIESDETSLLYKDVNKNLVGLDISYDYPFYSIKIVTVYPNAIV